MSILKVPPHNIEAEKAVLGSILIDNSVLLKVLENISSEAFYDPINKKIFSSIENIFNSQKPVDVLTLSSELKKDGNFKLVGGNSYISDLVSFVPTSANVIHYVSLVKEAFVRRKLISLGAKIDEESRDQKTKIEDLIDGIQKDVFSLTLETQDKDFFDSKTLLEMQMERADEYARNPESLRGLSTGFRSLDNMLQGLHKSDLIIVAARPSVGKSAFVFDISRHVATSQKKTVAIFSLEMPGIQVMERMLAQQTGINLWNIRMGKLRDKEYEIYNQGGAELAGSKIFVDETSGINIMQIRSKSRKLMMEEGLDLIVVDYLQLMQGRGSIENRALEIAEISRSLKILARELNIPIIALSQLNRAVENRQDKIPQLSDLRESGSIEQDADLVIFLGRDVNSSDISEGSSVMNNSDAITKIEVIIAKHRNGATGKISMEFIGTQTKFRDLETVS